MHELFAEAQEMNVQNRKLKDTTIQLEATVRKRVIC